MMWVLKPFALVLVKVALFLIGLPLVAIGLAFRREYPETRKPFTQYPGEWMLVRLPAWLLWWDNLSDGARGDKRGWWDNAIGGESASYVGMWRWMAIRNPVNYWSRYVAGVDVSKCTITKVSGDDVVTEEPGTREWQLLEAKHENGTTYRRFFVSWAITYNHALMIDIGWKIKLANNSIAKDAPESERIKGLVFVISPWKTLR